MLITKFETKSKRVKGLTFHKYRPWILASLHNGSINLFDFRAGILLEKFEEHEGPVRGVHFHDTQPLFVSGGDDHKVKVWNYKTKKCLFTLHGHLDYVRTVEFHNELPWICTCSDDQTIRIWNWQNRNVIAILTGHTHYVMCATFHPEDTLLASASLDQTIRIWDFSKLKEKSMQKTGSRPNEIFGGTEVEVKHILEGHEKGVNWVTWHPTLKVVASGADDKTIKLWRLSGNKHWEMDTLKGHANNVSCICFHPRMEILISNSEDKSLRVWDMQRRTQIHMMRKDTDRFWILTAHSSQNYFASGYDNGFTVFKIERERFASQRAGSSIFFVKNKNICVYDLGSKEKILLAPVNTNGKQVLNNQPKWIYYNYFDPNQHDIILNFDIEGGCFIIYEYNKDIKTAKLISEKRGDNTLAAVFIGKDKICVLDKNKDLNVCNFDGSNVKPVQISKKTISKIEMIYPGPLGKILIQTEDSLLVFEISSKKIIAEMTATDVKNIVWSSNFVNLAVLTKTQVIILNNKLEIIHSQKESQKIKSGCFDQNNAFIYSTSTHIKYIFCEGKTSGMFRSIDEPVYIAFYMKNIIYYINRNGEFNQYEINNTDYLFKLALQSNNLQEVKEILSQGNLCGHKIVNYLKEQGHSEIALFFEKDLKSRFNLAISSGNIDVAFDTAKELKEKDSFLKLASTALLLGNYEISEKCYQIIKSLDKLNFFYATTGSITKLNRMQGVATNIGDTMLQYNTAMFSADPSERVKVLAQTNQIPLAYLTAKTHGLTEFEKTLEETLKSMDGVDAAKIIEESDQYARKCKAMLPIRPLYTGASEVFQMRNWPMSNLRAKEAEKAAEMFLKKKANLGDEKDAIFLESNEFISSNKEIASILSSIDKKPTAAQKSEAKVLLEKNNWGGDDDMEIIGDDMLMQDAEGVNAEHNLGDSQTFEQISSSDIFVPPVQGPDPLIQAVKKFPLISGLHVAIGDFKSALELLQKQLAVANYEPLKPIFVDIFTLAKVKMETMPHTEPLIYHLRQFGSLPYVSVTLSSLNQKLQRGYDLTTAGNFGDALNTYRSILQSIPVMTVCSEAEEKEVKDMIQIITEYITAMRVEIERKKVAGQGESSAVRAVELNCYMTVCQMQTAHKFLAYKSAMNNNYKMNNFIYASHFCRLILDLESTGIFEGKADVIPQHKKYYQIFQQKGTNAQKLKYDTNCNVALKEATGYLCAGSLSPLEDNKFSNVVKCQLDGSVYDKKYAGEICQTCQLSKLGVESIGMKILVEIQ